MRHTLKTGKIKMNYLFIVDPTDYKGYALNTMPFAEKENISNTLVHYSDDVTFEEYNKMNGGNLVALPWEEFNAQFEKPYLLTLQKDWSEITEEKWEDALECLPPQRWHRVGDYSVFFMMEAYTADLHGWYIKNLVTKKCFTALRSRFISDQELLKQLDKLSATADFKANGNITLLSNAD